MLERATSIFVHPLREFRLSAVPSLSFRRWPSTSAATKPRQPSTHPLPPHASAHSHTQTFFRSEAPKKILALGNPLANALNALFHEPYNDRILTSRLHRSPLMVRCFSDSEFTRHLLEMVIPQFACRSVRLLSLSEGLGCQLKLSVYETACYQHSLLRDWQAILTIVNMAETYLGRPSVRLLNWRCRALVETRHYTLLKASLGVFHKYNLQPTQRTFQLILSGNIRNRDLTGTRACIEEMLRAGYPVNASVHATIAKDYRNLGADPHVQQRALDALSTSPAPIATVIVNGLIQSQIGTCNLNIAQHLLSHFDQRTTELFASLLKTDSIVHHPSSIPLPPIQRFDLLPNAETFNMFINILVEREDLFSVLTVIYKMVDFNIKPTSDTIAALVAVHFACGHGDVGVRLVSELCRCGSRTSQALRSFRIASHCDPNLLYTLREVRPTTAVLNALLKGALPEYGLDAATAVLRIMRTNNLRPNIRTVHVLLHYLLKHEKFPPEMVLRILRQLTSSSLPISSSHLHLILNHILIDKKYFSFGAGWKSLAPQMGADRESQGLQNHPTPDKELDPTAGLPMRPYSTALALTKSLQQSLVARGVKASDAFFSLRVRYEGVLNSDPEAAQNIFDILLRRGIYPNQYHYAALMESYVRADDMQAAFNTMEAGRSLGIQTNVVMFTILISGFARRGEPQLALQAFQQMVTSGIRPDVPAIDALASAFFGVGSYGMAKKIIISMWSYIQPFPEDMHGASLQQLASRFRLLHNSNSSRTTLSKEERTHLRWRLLDLIRSWKKAFKRPGRFTY